MIIGDHIYVQRYNPIKYTHHGVVVGHNAIAHPVIINGAIHFTITNVALFIGDLYNCIDCDITDINFMTKLSALKQQMKKNPHNLIKIKKHKDALQPRQIVANALNFIKSGQQYCLLSKNCEMFAEYCVTGVMPIICDQVINNISQIISGKFKIQNINTTIYSFLN